MDDDVGDEGRIATLLATNDRVVVAVSGFGGSGKTTLADLHV